jgi:hypothetical protein
VSADPQIAIARYAAGLWPSPASFTVASGVPCFCCGPALMVSPMTATESACPRCHPLWPNALHRCRDPKAPPVVSTDG